MMGPEVRLVKHIVGSIAFGDGERWPPGPDSSFAVTQYPLSLSAPRRRLISGKL